MFPYWINEKTKIIETKEIKTGGKYIFRQRRVCRSVTVKSTYSLFLSLQNSFFLSLNSSQFRASSGDSIQSPIFSTVSRRPFFSFSFSRKMFPDFQGEESVYLLHVKQKPSSSNELKMFVFILFFVWLIWSFVGWLIFSQKPLILIFFNIFCLKFWEYLEFMWFLFVFVFVFFLFLMLGATGFELFFGCLGGHYWILWVYLEKFSFPVEEFMLLQQQAFVYGLNVWIPNFVSGSVLLQNFKRNLLKLLMGFIFIFIFYYYWKFSKSWNFLLLRKNGWSLCSSTLMAISSVSLTWNSSLRL